MRDGMGNASWKPYWLRPQCPRRAGSCQVSLWWEWTWKQWVEFNCLGTELLQECKETIKAAIKTLSPTLNSRGLSQRRFVGQTHKLYLRDINAETWFKDFLPIPCWQVSSAARPQCELPLDFPGPSKGHSVHSTFSFPNVFIGIKHPGHSVNTQSVFPNIC